MILGMLFLPVIGSTVGRLSTALAALGIIAEGCVMSSGSVDDDAPPAALAFSLLSLASSFFLALASSWFWCPSANASPSVSILLSLADFLSRCAWLPLICEIDDHILNAAMPMIPICRSCQKWSAA
jgi:hypothetical protein